MVFRGYNTKCSKIDLAYSEKKLYKPYFKVPMCREPQLGHINIASVTEIAEVPKFGRMGVLSLVTLAQNLNIRLKSITVNN